jgi:hypothetical protein
MSDRSPVFFNITASSVHHYTATTQRDHQILLARMLAAGAIYPSIYARLRGHPKAELLKIAHYISRVYDVRDADRLCQRQFCALVCWFCENISLVTHEYPSFLIDPSVPIASKAVPEFQVSPAVPEKELVEVPFDDGSPYDLGSAHSDDGFGFLDLD